MDESWSDLSTATSVGLGLFFTPLLVIAVSHPQLFTKRYGRRHRVAGLAQLVWLIFGYVWILWDVFGPASSHDESKFSLIGYDVILGILGTTATLTAAQDFKRVHEKVKNVASGTLEPHATVTYAEMVEHSFYQVLNLLQILFLHSMTLVHPPLSVRAILLVGVTCPWIIRPWFPVHSFRSNYETNRPWTLISVMYRVKKYQYVFYKHVLLHGLNIAVALSGAGVSQTIYFRLYWLALNTSYVMEFFLQTMVKKKVISQFTLLVLQKILMFFSSTAALPVLFLIPLPIPFVSCLLNFLHRGHDLLNTIGVFVFIVMIQSFIL